MRFIFLFCALMFSMATYAGECKGTAENCEMLGASACPLQRNCSLDPFTHQCSGMVIQCNFFSSQGSCQMQRGCHWEDSASRTEPKRQRP